MNQHKKGSLAVRTVNPGTGEWVVPEDEHSVACESIDSDICGLQGLWVCGVLQTYWQSADEDFPKPKGIEETSNYAEAKALSQKLKALNGQERIG